jgi:lauroyl/myristoyl acyltransferase
VNFQDIVNGRLGIGFAMLLGRSMPPRLGRRLATIGADIISGRRGLAMVQAVRTNQYVASGQTLTRAELDDSVREAYRYAARFIFDTYHYMDKELTTESLVRIDGRFNSLMERMGDRQQGTVIVIVHTGNPDLAIRTAASQGLRLLGLAMNRPGRGYQWQNTMRNLGGIETLAASVDSMRRAIKWLDQGGTVATGVDRPMPESGYKPCFFDHRAAMPVHYASLAMKAEVPIFMFAAYLREDGLYSAEISDPIEMNQGGDRRSTILENAERVLSVAEQYISRYREQWMMFYPVWPDVRPP